MNTTLRKALRTEYALLRTPLAVLDERVLTRLDAHSPIRVAVERGLSALDTAAARVLAEPPAAGAGGAVPAGPEELPVDEVAGLADELLAEQEQEHNLAGELAEDEQLRRVQAELKAKHHVEEEHEAGRG